MKKLMPFIAGLLLTVSAFCQKSEFKVYPNGLIYSEQSMARLGHIVDSLNLKFKSCDANRILHAVSQTIGHLITLSKGNIKAARKDLEKEIPLEEFLIKYPAASIERDVLILKSRYRNYQKEDIVEIEHFDVKTNYGFSIKSTDLSLYQKDFTGKWLYRYDEKTEYTEASLTAFYFPKNFSSAPVPKKYSQMIGYTDCLIDTTTAKFKDNLKEGWIELPENWRSFSEKKKVKLLDDMRSTRVVGGCSMDSRPREHAVNIALLSAETYNWEVFLKAHLDIMNDRFERMSDGSYAWGQRKTYIKELEVLNINVPDLLLGITFRIEDPALHHYYGNIARVGRALSETKTPDAIEQVILSIIADNELDYYNRLLFYFLFKHYNNNLKDEARKKENTVKLASATKTLPEFLSKKLTEN